jgi:hypothetical protein
MKKKSRSKSKDEPNLVWINKPSINDKNKSNAFKIGVNTWTMFNEDFNLTIREICHILKCERKWVLNNIKDNVKHIFLNNDFRLFLNNLDKYNHLNIYNPGNYLKDYYYFSRKDFFKWLNDNTKITRQTIQINIENYSKSTNKLRKLKENYFNKEKEIIEDGANAKKLAALKLQFELEIYSLVNDIGKHLLENIVILTKRDASVIDVTNQEELPNEFTTIKILKEDKSLELLYRKLYFYGSLKYTIADSLVRYDTDYTERGLNTTSHIITVPYEVYLSLI